MTETLRVLIVDDEALARARLARLVAECPAPACVVVGEAGNAAPALVRLAGPHDTALLDVVYVSATTFTTLGYGDFVPVGHLRFLFGMEALTGLVLVTWSASLTFLEMQRHWQERPPKG